MLVLGAVGLSAWAAPRLPQRQLRQMEREGQIVRLPHTKNNLNSLVTRIDNPAFFTKEAMKAQEPENLLLNTRGLDAEMAADVYGYLFYTSDTSKRPYGLYDLAEGDLKKLWSGIKYQGWNFTPLNGWYSDDKVCGVTMDTDGNFIFNYCYYEVNFNRGNLLTMDWYGIQNLMFYRCFLNPDDNKIYGYVQDVENSNYWWGVADMSTPNNISLLKLNDDNYCYSLCYNGTDGNIYGITIKQQFVRIAPDGTQTVISSVPEGENMDTAPTGLAWCATDGRFYWNATMKDFSGRLYSISPEGTFEVVTLYPYEEQFTFFLNTQTVVNPNNPEAPVVENVNFVDNSLTGTITYKVPQQYGDGRPLPATVNYFTTINGEQYSTGTTQPGKSLTVEFTLANRGLYTLGFAVSTGDYTSSLATVERYIGNDNPVAPANVVLTNDMISWSPVTQSEFGGYMDVSKMSYKVYLNDKFVGETTDTSMAVIYDQNTPVEAFVGSVVAVCNGCEGKPGYSNKIIEGKAYSLPAYFMPTAEEFELMTVIDANNDREMWAYDIVYDAVSIYYSEHGPMNDYVFLPPVQIDKADAYYRFSCEVSLRTPAYPEEYMEVVYASLPDLDHVEGVIIDSYKPTIQYVQDNWNQPVAYWKAPRTGKYFIGIRCKSAELQFGMIARNFRIDTSDVGDDSLTAPEGLTAIPGEKGALTADVSFTFPKTTVDGNTVNVPTLVAKIYANGEQRGQIEGAPGSKAQTKITTDQGYNNISVIVYNGNVASYEASVNIYTGYTYAAIPTDLKADVSPDMYKATISWSPVTTPYSSEGYINPETITYNIWKYSVSEFAQIPYWEIIASDIKGTSYEFSIPEGTAQDFFYIGVASVNEAGSNDLYDYLSILMGKPYDLPFVGVVGPDGFTTDPWYEYSSLGDKHFNGYWSGAVLGELLPEFDGDRTYVAVGYPQSVPGNGLLCLPRVSTLNINEAYFTFDMLFSPETCDVEVVASIYGSDDLIPVGSISGDVTNVSEFRNVSFKLPERLLNQDWVQFYIMTTYTDPDNLFVMRQLTISGEPAGVESIGVNSSIRSGKGYVECRGFYGSEILIVDLQGRVMVKEVSNSDLNYYYLAKGLYLVKAGNETRKVIVE